MHGFEKTHYRSLASTQWSLRVKFQLAVSHYVCTGFSSEGRAKLRVGVLNVPWPNNSKPLEVERNKKAHHNKTPLSSCSSVLNLFLFMFTHLSNYACTFLGTFPLLGTQLSPSLTRKPCIQGSSIRQAPGCENAAGKLRQ